MDDSGATRPEVSGKRGRSSLARDRAQLGGDGSEPAWPEPGPLPPACEPVPALDPDLLPSPIRECAVDAAERLSVSIELLAAPHLVSIGAAIGRRIGIAPRRHDDWTVICSRH